ncbi:hypothetical protein [Carnobacterium jeotgali]|uniref:hypothetical protein n=1 Tax=Carnobacterium jeotgali TaxID=545534 RepID=UPI00068A8518|nr:hypothetical protein [Carnobacterium jeotgali]
MNNWAKSIMAYPLPDRFPNSYIEVIKDEVRDHVENGGKVTDERTSKLFLKLCRFVDTFLHQDIDWTKQPNDYLEEIGGASYDNYS